MTTIYLDQPYMEPCVCALMIPRLTKENVAYLLDDVILPKEARRKIVRWLYKITRDRYFMKEGCYTIYFLNNEMVPLLKIVQSEVKTYRYLVILYDR